MTASAEALQQLLFEEGEGNVYVILDGAGIPDLRMHLFDMEPQHVCLYRGETKPDIAEVAPYLVRLEPDTPFTDWVLEGWGKHWGIFVISGVDLDFLRRHFRGFLVVHDSNGKPLMFRYYDPRVLRVFLPTCNAEELTKLFGPVSKFVTEAEQPDAALVWEQKDGALKKREAPLKK